MGGGEICDRTALWATRGSPRGAGYGARATGRECELLSWNAGAARARARERIGRRSGSGGPSQRGRAPEGSLISTLPTDRGGADPSL